MFRRRFRVDLKSNRIYIPSTATHHLRQFVDMAPTKFSSTCLIFHPPEEAIILYKKTMSVKLGVTSSSLFFQKLFFFQTIMHVISSQWPLPNQYQTFGSIDLGTLLALIDPRTKAQTFS